MWLENEKIERLQRHIEQLELKIEALERTVNEDIRIMRLLREYTKDIRSFTPEEQEVSKKYNKILEIYNKLKNDLGPNYIDHPNGAYGWDNVARWQKLISEERINREYKLMKLAIKIAQLEEDKRNELPRGIPENTRWRSVNKD